MKVPFYSRCHGDSEIRYMRDCLLSGMETDGPFMEKIRDYAGRIFPDSFQLYTTSCTAALETVMSCLDLVPGDEVIVPSFNFPSAANAVLIHGGTPVLCDVSPDTQNISVKDAASRITPRTRAVVAVHYAGVSCPMGELKKLAGEAGLALIEDAAQGIGARYHNIPLGAVGDFGTISFHYTKNIICGEGGLMLTRLEAAYGRARQYRLHGTNRSLYLNGEIERYTWNMKGSCTALGEPGAALLASQLEILGEVTAKRLEILREYRRLLGILEEKGIARLMAIPDYAQVNGHIFYLRFEDEKQMERTRKMLLEHEIECKGHYVPLHMSPAGRELGYRETDMPESRQCYRTLLRLPIHPGLDERQVEYTAEMVKKSCGLGGA